jgi:8-oxo-dGTP pyrophosphatase MutT (NUDIX family)
MDNECSLKKKLENYQPHDQQEKTFKQEMLNFIEAFPNCFERSLEKGHFTGSCWLLNKDGSKALLMHHTKLNKWLQLGGHCDGDRDILGVAIKEAQEESGIKNIVPVSKEIFDIDIHPIPERTSRPEHLHYDVRFLLQVASDEEIVQNRESKELRWIGKESKELPTNSRSVVRMFEKWINL